MRFSRSFCLLLTEFFLLIRREIPVRSLTLCQILQIFTVNFQRYFRSKYKFCKIFEGTRSLNMHLREPGVLARTRAISSPGRTRQETISSHLNCEKTRHLSLSPDSYPVAFRRRKREDAEDFGKEMRGAQRVMGRTNSEKIATGR